MKKIVFDEKKHMGTVRFIRSADFAYRNSVTLQIAINSSISNNIFKKYFIL